MPIEISPITCPSCYRQHGKETLLFPFKASYHAPINRARKEIFVYECHECSYHVTQHELLYHEFRVRYNRALNVLLHIRGWCKSKFNSPPGKVWVIDRAVDTYFEQYQLNAEVWDQYKEAQRKGEV